MSEDRQHPGSLDPEVDHDPVAGPGVAREAPPDLPGVQPPASRREQGSLSNLFAPGSRVGRYRLLAPLASGGMAQVWAAKPESPGFARTVALKLIRHEYASDEEYVRMFIDEATVAASIHHPNVCETYELGREDGVLFMAIEWVAGDSLAGLLHRSTGLQPVAEPIAARIIADACAGLHAAHDAVGPDGVALGVVHRDVSPPNILLSLHGQVKVSDFGIAKARLQIHSKTRTGEIKGKFAYIAPEQIGGKGIDLRADIFALGCVLYVATLGLRPFGSGPRAMSKILAGEYKKPRELIESYPAALEGVILRALQKSPADRYQSAEEMRMDVERWLMTLDMPVGTKDLSALVNTRLEPKKRKVVETLMRTNQFLPDAMVYQLVRGEVEQTPTATSSVMFGPLSNPTIKIPDSAPLPERRAGAKPMVRFTALGRPMTAEFSEGGDPSPGMSRGVRSGPVTDPTELTDEPTSADLDRRSAPASSMPPEDSSIGPTYRPPGLRPVANLGGGRRPAALIVTIASRRFWMFAFVASAIAAGWASCQFIPQ